jgi:mRNA-degrading endonuclease RelE of RelBE toxin-antitoxin system
VTWQVLWESSALNAAAGFLKDDPASVDALLMATDQLAEDPRPAGSRAWGVHHRRLHHGPWRILYRVDPDAQSVHVEHIGRTGL